MTVKQVANKRRNAIDAEMAKLLKLRLCVGIPAAAGAHPGSDVTNATIGYLNEFGDDAMGIPPRPFLVPGIESVQGEIAAEMAKGATLVFANRPAAVAEANLMRAGLIAQDAVRAKITDGLSPPLATATLRRRKDRKQAPRQGEKPLLDTGELLKSITFVIERK